MTNAARFDKLFQEIEGDITQVVTDDYVDLINRIEAAAERAKAGMFKELADVIVGAKSTPQALIDEGSGGWSQLSPAYVAWKRKNGKGEGYYKKSGRFKNRLNALADDAAGETSAYVSQSMTVGDPNIAGRYEEWKGETVYRYVSGPKRGAFASARNRLQKLPGAVRIMPYKGLNRRDPEATVFGRGTKSYFKSKNPRRGTKGNYRLTHERPFLAAWLDWWTHNRLTQAVEREIKR